MDRDTPLPTKEPSNRKVSWTLRCLILGLYVYCGLVLFSTQSVQVELAVHFLMHVLVGSLLIGLLTWWRGNRIERVALVVPLLYLLFLARPWALWFPSVLAEAPQEMQDTIRVISWNMLYTNRNREEVRQVLSAREAEIVILIEVAPKLLDDEQWIKDKFRGMERHEAWHGDGIAVLTTRNDVVWEKKIFDDEWLPAIVITVPSRSSGKKIKLVAMHTASPMPPERAIPRDRQLRAFREWALQQTDPVCLIGDLNTTPWTRSFAELEMSGFRDSRQQGFGNCPSWPAQFGLFGIPIDHALSRGECRIGYRNVGPPTSGSDHRPLYLDISF